jgi:hypothetical protein
MSSKSLQDAIKNAADAVTTPSGAALDVVGTLRNAPNTIVAVQKQVTSKQRVELETLLEFDFLYLTVFGVVGLLLPGLSTFIYGGDAYPYYAADWARFVAAGSVSIGLFSLLLLRWKRDLVLSRTLAVSDGVRLMTFFFALSAAVSALSILRGALSIFCLVNVAVSGALAYFHFLEGGNPLAWLH